MRMVIVEWEDSAFAQGWMSRDSVKTHSVSIIVSVGLLVAENDKQITIMQSDSVNTEQYGDGMTIPKSAITRIRRLKIGGECG